MIPVVGVVGKKNSGKTTLIEKIVQEMRKRGYRVGTIKHDVHGFEIDIPGKDTYRHRMAGSSLTIISSPDKVALVELRDREMDLDEILERFVENVDLVITEGYKSHPIPKIEVYDGKELLLKDDENLLCIVGDYRGDSKVPIYDPDEREKIADLIEEKVIKPNPVPPLWLFINDRHVPLKDFIRTMFYEIIKGMIKSLKKVGKPGKVVIKVWYGE